MKITQAYAKKLIKAGKATATNEITESNGDCYAVITRHDIGRVDHAYNTDCKITINPGH